MWWFFLLGNMVCLSVWAGYVTWSVMTQGDPVKTGISVAESLFCAGTFAMMLRLGPPRD